MGWQAVVGLNAIIAVCYLMITSLIVIGLVRTRQLRTNALALATASIFATCAAHHAHHAAHVWFAFGGEDAAQLDSVRAVFGEWHAVLIDLVGATVAVTYLSLRRNYGALLRTPAMFDDAVRVAAQKRLRELAFTDQLTGVPNRASYQALADSLADDPRETTVLFLDLDRFKLVNDVHGHDIGDRLLREVAQRLQERVPADCALFRLGGDEFVVVAVGLGEDGVPARVGQVVDAVEEPMTLRSDQAVSVGASVGAATGPAATTDELLRLADMRMYVRKGQRVPAARQAVTP